MSRIAFALVCLMSLGAIACDDRGDTYERSDAAGTQSDAAVTEEVTSRLESDPELAAHDLAVETQGGVVTLRGRVEREDQKAAAERAARDVAGVGSVVNRVEVATPPVAAPPPATSPPADS